MSRELLDGSLRSVDSRIPLAEVADTLLGIKGDAVLVHSDAPLVGMVPTHDLLRALAGRVGTGR